MSTSWRNFGRYRLLDSALAGERGDDQQRIAETCCKIAELLLRKNTDYGGSAWQVPVLSPTLDIGTAILCRASDKIARLSRLLAGNPNEVQESVTDTMLDLAGYIILWLARPRSTEAHAHTGKPTTRTVVDLDRPPPGTAFPHDSQDGAPEMADHVSER